MTKMKSLNALTVAAALAGAVSMATVVTATPAFAGGKVKCYGISKAGENGCASKSGTHSCAGQAGMDYSGEEWQVSADSGACKDAGGSEAAFKGINKNVKM
jgi:uncharacterized membrane protein